MQSQEQKKSEKKKALRAIKEKGREAREAGRPLQSAAREIPALRGTALTHDRALRALADGYHHGGLARPGALADAAEGRRRAGHRGNIRVTDV